MARKTKTHSMFCKDATFVKLQEKLCGLSALTWRPNSMAASRSWRRRLHSSLQRPWSCSLRTPEEEGDFEACNIQDFREEHQIVIPCNEVFFVLVLVFVFVLKLTKETAKVNKIAVNCFYQLAASLRFILFWIPGNTTLLIYYIIDTN